MTLVKFKNANGNRSLLPGFNGVFDSIFNDTFFNERIESPVPAVNTSETADFFHVEMAAPGLKKEDFKVTIDRNLLSISCEMSEENGSDEKKYTRREYRYTSFVRSFTLPDLADTNKIEASYNDGILKLDIGKREEAKTMSRQIELK